MTFTVTFDANGGEGTMEPQTFQANEPQYLTANAFYQGRRHLRKLEHRAGLVRNACYKDTSAGHLPGDRPEHGPLCEVGKPSSTP